MPRHDSTTDPRQFPDWIDVKGQEGAKRALEIAAAGGHPILLTGPPGAGKTMLARCVLGILPEPTEDEAARIAERYRAAGLEPPPGRPFLAPPPNTPVSELVGGRKPGEVTLAKGGVLFLDQLTTFDRRALRALRQPLEDNGRPWDPMADDPFLLIAAMRPCPCGQRDDWRHECTCPPWKLARYTAGIRELFVDLVHLHATVPALDLAELRAGPGERSQRVAERVQYARQRQQERSQGALNAFLRPSMLPKYCQPDNAGLKLLDHSYDRLGLTSRSAAVLLRTVRSISDLAACERPRARHVAEAVQYAQK